MTLLDAFSHECRTRLARPAALLGLAMYAAALIYGAISGRIERDARIEAIARHEADIAARMQKWSTDLKSFEETGAPRWSGSAMDVVFASSLPPAPLADFAVGQSDLLPYAGALSLWDPDIRLFSRYEFEDPVSLALGAFDLSKAVILMLPMVLIALCFDVVSAERDAHRLNLILVQGGRIRSLCWSRLLIRAGAAASLTIAIAVGALVVHAGVATFADRLAAFLWWGSALALYTTFWTAVIAFVASRNGRGGANLVVLLLAWVSFTVILPASVSAVSEALYPAPSRLMYLAESREAEVAAELADAALRRQFALDHPEFVVNDAADMPGYVRTAFLVTTAVDEATRPIMDAFDAAAAQRENTLIALHYLSPAIVMHGVFNDLAGASSARHRRYMTQANAFKAQLGQQVRASVMSGGRLRSRDVAAIPQFQFADQPWAARVGRTLGALLFLAIAASVLLVVADIRLRRASVYC